MPKPNSMHDLGRSIRVPRAWDLRYYTFWHVTRNGNTLLALRDRRQDLGVLIWGVIFLLTPLLVPFGLEGSFLWNIVGIFFAMLVFHVVATQRRLLLTWLDGTIEVRSGFFATPRSWPIGSIPNPRLIIRPVRVTAHKWGLGGTRGFGCLLIPVGSRAAMLAFAPSRDAIHRLIQASPVLCYLEVIDEDEELAIHTTHFLNV